LATRRPIDPRTPVLRNFTRRIGDPATVTAGPTRGDPGPPCLGAQLPRGGTGARADAATKIPTENPQDLLRAARLTMERVTVRAAAEWR